MKPNEWLLEITATQDGYRRLLEETGSLAVAAWRLAVAKCLTQDVSTHVPSGREVRAAARQIIDRTGAGEPLPAVATLAFDCERVGLLVI